MTHFEALTELNSMNFKNFCAWNFLVACCYGLALQRAESWSSNSRYDSWQQYTSYL